MELRESENLYYTLAESFGIKEVPLSFMKRMKNYRTAGHCKSKYILGKWKSSIYLQPTFVEKNLPTIVRLTIIHELAHSVCPKNGHGKIWKRIAREMGSSGERYYSKLVKK